MAVMADAVNQIGAACSTTKCLPCGRRGAGLGSVVAAMVLAGLTGCSSFHTQSHFADQLEDETKAWEEIAIQLPPAPLEANLLPFDAGATTTQRFAVDEKSLSVGADGVVRFTLVALSTGGAKNVSYEGIRCASREQKIYALGHPDGSWSRSRRDQWQRIDNDALNRQQSALAKGYFCLGNAVAGNQKDIATRMQRQQTLTDDLLR